MSLDDWVNLSPLQKRHNALLEALERIYIRTHEKETEREAAQAIANDTQYPVGDVQPLSAQPMDPVDPAKGGE